MTEKVIKFGTDGFRGIIAKDFTVEKVEYIAHGISPVSYTHLDVYKRQALWA